MAMGDFMSKLNFAFRSVTVFILCAGFSAHAYHLDDHETIMRQAYAEFAACFPSVVPMLNVDTLVSGDLAEDENLLTKELFYSHYYNPNKEITQYRKGSDGRIADLSPGLMQCRAAGTPWSDTDTMNLGYALHHFQDMSVPAHVVPVIHGLDDGFEVYSQTGDISSQWTCAQIVASYNEDLETVLKDTAETTLTNVSALSVEMVDTANSQASTITGLNFWIQSDDLSFGQYGSVGNVFGQTSFSTDNGQMQVSDNAYRIFKAQQEQLAVRATLRGLVWVFSGGPQ
jgi:hypothetical protein